MSVFISYARKDEEVVSALSRDIERTRREVWVDERLTGGQAWWDTILAEIRRCDLFISAISPDSVKSRACNLELDYALALGKTVLPVVVRDVALQLAPTAIANAQAIRYTDRTADSILELTTALATARPSAALPSPLPAPPLVPITYLGSLQQQVAAPSLGFHEQSSLLMELRTHVQSDDVRDAALDLLRELRNRADVVESVGREVDTILAEAANAHTAPTATAGAWHPDPYKRYELRYWDGASWTDHVLRGGQRFVDAPQRAPGGPTRTGPGTQPSVPPGGTGGGPTPHESATSTGVPPFTGGVFALLIIASLFCFGVVGIVTALVNLKHPSRKSQSVTLLVVGIGVMLLGLLAVAVGLANQNSTGY